jgi:hypothetical protein
VPSTRREGKKEGSAVVAAGSLRAERGWLEPYVMLIRYWRAFSGMPPPLELRVLLERVLCGEGLYVYVH